MKFEFHFHFHDDSNLESSKAVRRIHRLRERIKRSTGKLQHALEGSADTTPLAFNHSEKPQMNNLDEALDTLTAEVSEEETVMDSAIAYIVGVPALIQAAIDAALADGSANAAQLARFTELKSKLDAKGEALKAALAPPTT